MMRMAAIEAARVEEDEVLPTANIPPLMPHPLATGKLPPACEPTLLEAWHLVHRFSELLGIHAANVPSLAQLEAAVLEGPGAAQHSDVSQLDSCSRVIVAMLNFLVADLYQATVHLITENSADVREADLRASNKSPHPIPVTADTWEEVARRYLAVAASAAMAWGKDGGSGLPAPLSALDPHLVLQLLTAGPPAHLAESSANLPRGAAPHAWWGMVVQADAAAMVAASDMLKVTPVPAEKLEAAMKVQRCILMQLANLKGEKGGKSARLLCFQGQGAAAAQKSGRPLDLRAVAARVDAGLYARSADPLSPFVADICYVCGLHQQAANKHTTGFAAENAEKGIAEAAAMVVSEMERLVEDARRSGTSAFLEKYGVAEADAAGTTDHEGGEDGEDGAPVPDANGAAVLDLGRPFAPWEGCAACWGDEDGEKMLECSKCGVLFHSYCHRPPLEEVPDGDWACRRCAGGAAAATGAVKFAPSSGGARLRRMAQKLGATTVAAWEPKERVELLGLVCSLMEDSPALRDRLLDEAADLQDIRKELHAKRSELKHRQQEEAAAAGPEAPGGDQAQETADEAARPAGRRARDVALEIEALVKRISELEHMATQVQPQRLEPIGMDRHWNRYWILPAAALGMQNVGDRPGAVVIERYYLDSVSRGERSVDSVPTSPRFGAHDWQVGIYRNTEALDKLLSWLNPKGVRERALQTELRRAAANIEETARLAQQAKSSEPPRTPMETAMDAAMAAQAGLELSMECLRAALLDFEAGLMPKSRHPELGSPQEMEAWRERVSKARHPTLLMANLLTLESAINPEWLKPHWRPWAMPAPAPASATAPAAVWLRFEALKSATRMKIALHVPISVREVMSGRYGLREQGAKRPAGDAQDSEGSGGDVAASRAARAAKRARKEEDEDEALARQLDAELNAGRRPLRSRLRDGGGSKEGRGNGGRYRGSLRAETKKSYASASEGSEEWEDEDVESSEESEEQEGKVGKKKRGRADSEEEYNSAGDDDDNDA